MVLQAPNNMVGLTEAYLNGTPGSLDLRSWSRVRGLISLTVVKADRNIVRSGRGPERALAANRNGVHGLRVSNNVTGRRTSVKHERMAKPGLNCTSVDPTASPSDG